MLIMLNLSNLLCIHIYIESSTQPCMLHYYTTFVDAARCLSTMSQIIFCPLYNNNLELRLEDIGSSSCRSIFCQGMIMLYYLHRFCECVEGRVGSSIYNYYNYFLRGNPG